MNILINIYSLRTIFHTKLKGNFMRNIYIYIFALILPSFTFAAGGSDITLVDVFKSYMSNVHPIINLMVIFSTVAGIYFIGNAAYRLTKLGKDQQVTGKGITVRFIVGGLLFGLPIFIAMTSGILFNNGESKNFFEKSLEQAAKPAGDAVSGKGCLANGTNCDMY